MTRLYLIRHAEAEGNLYRIAQGQDNSNLTDRGWRQVRALERRFEGVPIDAVYASDLYRTCATASAICGPRQLPLHRDPALREVHLGVWERRTWGEIYRRWPEEMDHFSHRPDLWRLEGAEDPRAARTRLLGALRRIAADHPGETVAVFTHGYVLRLTLSYLQGLELDQLDGIYTGDNTAVSLVEAEGDTLRLVYRDDNSHLKTPEFLAGERVTKRYNGLEGGLWFAPVPPEKAEAAAALAAACRPAETPSGPPAEDPGGTLLAGYLQEELTGLVRVDPASGWISLLCIRPDRRRRGLGVQLLGRAVQQVRAAGGQTLRAALPADGGTRAFLEVYGFRPAPDGGGLEKSIAFRPEFLGE